MLNNGYWAGVKIAKPKIDKLTYISIYHTSSNMSLLELFVHNLYFKIIDVENFKIISTIKYKKIA